jgi:hypothetical protein
MRLTTTTMCPAILGLLAAGLTGCWDDSGSGPAETTAAPAATESAELQSSISAPPALEHELDRPRHSDADSPRFTLAVLPDTQYLLDDDRTNPEPLAATFRFLLAPDAFGREDRNIRFLAQLGDVTEHGTAAEMALADQTFRAIDGRLPYSVIAGNHDVHGDDQRGASPFLATFGPERFRHDATFGGASPDGYNRYHVFTAGGRSWLVLALDWRLSDAGFAWAQQVLREHPTLPVIVTTHEIAGASDDGVASLSGYGQTLWDRLIRKNDQIFLTLNGHYWPPGRTVLRNDAGHDVYVHITNYQDRYFGGNAMVRLYGFDLARNRIDIETLSPWVLGKRADDRNLLEQQEVELTDDVNRFSLAIDFDQRFAGFAPVAPRPARPAPEMLVPGTVAYWRFDAQASDGAQVPTGATIPDASHSGNDLTVVRLGASAASAITWTTDHHADQPAHTSLVLDGGSAPTRGAYLRTGDTAPLNRMHFERGYTIEAFVKIPRAFNDGGHNWMGLLSWTGRSGDAGKTGGDPQEPVASLNLSSERFLQWISYPLPRNDALTSWGHALPTDTWIHLAVVNDGRHTVVYVDGSPIARNPHDASLGIATTGTPFVIGGTQYANTFDQGFFGTVGDVRIVNHALPVRDFMIGHRGNR